MIGLFTILVSAIQEKSATAENTGLVSTVQSVGACTVLYKYCPRGKSHSLGLVMSRNKRSGSEESKTLPEVGDCLVTRSRFQPALAPY
jgi:hypothetical protein